MQEIWDQLQQTTWLEIIAMVTGLLFPIFAAYEKKICWLFGGISSLIYIYLMFIAQLYSDAILNFYYVVMAFVGYLTWSGIIKVRKKEVKVSYANFRLLIIVSLIAAVYSVVSGYIFLRYTNASYPFLDATLTGFAFIATWLETRKKIENWYIFLVVDGLSIWLFWKKGYILTAILFIIYCIICIYGIIQWHRKIKLST
jgi:nicotinamide mononucleotide transporter